MDLDVDHSADKTAGKTTTILIVVLQYYHTQLNKISTFTYPKQKKATKIVGTTIDTIYTRVIIKTLLQYSRWHNVPFRKD